MRLCSSVRARTHARTHVHACARAHTRNTHTQVLLRTMLDHARGSQGLSLDDSVLEGGPDRVFRLRPRLAVLGQIKEAQVYRFKMVLSNCGNQIARFRIRQPENDSVSIIYAPGGVAAGMSVVLEVEVWAEECGQIDTQFAIETETECFTIPIQAVVLDAAEFAEWQEQGGQLPCNVAAVDQTPVKLARSRAPAVATLKKQLAQARCTCARAHT